MTCCASSGRCHWLAQRSQCFKHDPRYLPPVRLILWGQAHRLDYLKLHVRIKYQDGSVNIIEINDKAANDVLRLFKLRRQFCFACV
jgi:hypothetical protein